MCGGGRKRKQKILNVNEVFVHSRSIALSRSHVPVHSHSHLLLSPKHGDNLRQATLNQTRRQLRRPHIDRLGVRIKALQLFPPIVTALSLPAWGSGARNRSLTPPLGPPLFVA